MANELGDWFRSVPIVTRWWFTLSVVLPLLGRIGLINARWMYLDWELVVYNFHFWRPVTALFYYPLSPQTGFHWLLMIYFMYNYSKGLESESFTGKPASYLYMLIFNWMVCTGLCMAVGIPFMLEAMVMSTLYVWCELNSERIVSFWFGTQFKAVYLPWVLCAFNAILRGGGVNELLGIFIGHLYVFLAFKWPAEHGGSQIIRTPEFLYRLLPDENGGVYGMGGRVDQARAGGDQQPQRPLWGGAGRPLGGAD